MLQLVFFGIVLLIIAIAALLMPWHAKRGQKRLEQSRSEREGNDEL